MRHLAERHIACPVTRHNKIYTFDSVTTFRCALHYNAIALINDKYAKLFKSYTYMLNYNYSKIRISIIIHMLITNIINYI